MNNKPLPRMMNRTLLCQRMALAASMNWFRTSTGTPCRYVEATARRGVRVASALEDCGDAHAAGGADGNQSASFTAIGEHFRQATDNDGSARRQGGRVPAGSDRRRCIHTPPPPANQMVHVRYPEGVEIEGLFSPVWIRGTMMTEETTQTVRYVDGQSQVDVSYAMSADLVEPYQ